MSGSSIPSLLRRACAFLEGAETSFPEQESLDLIARRRGPYLAAIEKVAGLCRLRGDALRDYQTQAVRKLLERACETVPFYRQRYRAAGFSPDQFRTLDDLQHVPLVDKAEWRAAPLEALRSRTDVAGEAWLLSSSGSTGTPSRVFRDASAVWYFMARSLMLFREWSQPRPFASTLYFLDFAPGSIDFLIADMLRTTVAESRIVASSRSTDEHRAALRKYRPEFISSYPSTMRNLAMALDRRRETFPDLRLLHVTSEMLDRGTRALVERVFPQARVIETYTSTEAGLIAFPCPGDGRLHIAEEGVLCEIVDPQGRPTDDLGEMVVTDLTNQATPVLRYRGLGDFARWERGPCGCGSPCRAIRHLEGRVADSILTPAGTWLSPYEVIDVIEDLPGIYQFQIVQHAADTLLVRIVRDAGAQADGDRLTRLVSEAIAARLPGVACQIEFVLQILPESGRHKVPLVISRLARDRATALAPRRLA